MRKWIALFETATAEDAVAYRREVNDWVRQHCPNTYVDWMPGNSPDEVEISNLHVSPEARFKGEGRRAMAKACEAADRYGITLSLLPVPNDEDGPGLDSEDLRLFYNSFGFEWASHNGADMMFRFPG